MAEREDAHHAFDKEYWEQHWTGGPGAMDRNPPNPHLVREIDGLVPGTALDAGCGAGAEAIWLASNGLAGHGSRSLDRSAGPCRRPRGNERSPAEPAVG